MDKFVRNIYFVVLGGLFVIAFIVLLVYYSQGSEVKYNFKESINLDEVDFSYQIRNDRVYNENTSQYENQEFNYLSHIKGNIGSITLINNGVFPKHFEVDDMLVCLNYVDHSESEVFQGISLRFDGYTVRDEKTISLDVDSGVWIKEEVIWGAKVNGFNVYLIPEESDNPFSRFNRNFDFEKGRFDCESIGSYLEPVAFIQLGK